MIFLILNGLFQYSVYNWISEYDISYIVEI